MPFEGVQNTYKMIRKKARKRGWIFVSVYIAKGGTRYLTLARGLRTLKIRIADHGYHYSNNDFDISVSPEDEPIQAVYRKLKQA